MYTYNLIETSGNAEFTAQSVVILQQKILNAIEQYDSCILGLSGGSTPRPVYEELGQRSDIDWQKVQLFLVDERYVPPDHAESNQKLVRDTLLKHADVPPDQCYFPDTSLGIEDCVLAYARSFVDLFAARPPDVMVLGLGPDGHTASLFPPLPKEAFGEVLALHTTTDTFAVHDRITVSPLVLMAAQAHLLLLQGEEKRRVFEECVHAELSPTRWPLHVVLGTRGLTAIAR